MMIDTVWRIGLNLFHAAECMGRNVSPAHVMTAKIKFAHEASQGVMVEYSQTPQAIGITVA
jgi:hypothetical protein